MNTYPHKYYDMNTKYGEIINYYLNTYFEFFFYHFGKTYSYGLINLNFR